MRLILVLTLIRIWYNSICPVDRYAPPMVQQMVSAFFVFTCSRFSSSEKVHSRETTQISSLILCIDWQVQRDNAQQYCNKNRRI
jgi:hypothetical protein